MEEKDRILPEESSAQELPMDPIPAEETIAEEAPIPEIAPELVSDPEHIPEEMPALEIPEKLPDAPVPVAEAVTADAVEEPAAQEVPAVEASGEEIPETQEQNPLTAAESSQNTAPDEHVIPAQDATPPIEAVPVIDLSILDDPDLDLDSGLLAEERPAPRKFSDDSYRGGGKDFEEAFAAPPEELEIPVHDRPTRKGRPKRKKGEGLLGIPHMLVTIVWLVIIVMVGVTLGRMLWICAAEVLAFGKEDKVVTVTVYESDTIEDITEKLHKAGLIQYPGLFKLYADLAVDEGEIDPGIWDLNTRYDYHALVNFMNSSSTRAVIEDLLIPEGYTCQQIFALLEENKVCTAKDLEEYAASGELKEYWFLEGVERGKGNCLEGFLFPDTYDFYKNSSPREVLEKLLDNFDHRFDEELQAQIATLNDHLAELMRKDGRSEETIAANRFDVRDVVIVASLIEKETANNAESYTIASVIYNRLFNWGSTPAFLNIDASIIYAQGGFSEVIDTGIDNPYNTYKFTGLTPGPIANPGLASLKAALAPATSNYYFYVLNPATGKHQFSTTLAEHEGYVAQFAANGG